MNQLTLWFPVTLTVNPLEKLPLDGCPPDISYDKTLDKWRSVSAEAEGTVNRVERGVRGKLLDRKVADYFIKAEKKASDLSAVFALCSTTEY